MLNIATWMGLRANAYLGARARLRPFIREFWYVKRNFPFVCPHASDIKAIMRVADRYVYGKSIEQNNDCVKIIVDREASNNRTYNYQPFSIFLFAILFNRFFYAFCWFRLNPEINIKWLFDSFIVKYYRSLQNNLIVLFVNARGRHVTFI